jgi:hypothetical protein
VLTGCAGEETPGLLADYDETVTVYVFKDDDADTKPSQNLLYPMQVDVDGEPTVEAAVEALTTYEPEKPYDTLWTGSCAIGKDLDKVTVTDKQIRVHFNESGGDLCDLSSPDLLEQQIAWTVRTATGSEAPVTVTVGDATPTYSPRPESVHRRNTSLLSSDHCHADSRTGVRSDPHVTSRNRAPIRRHWEWNSSLRWLLTRSWANS